MPIPGGYILQPRCIDNSDIMHESPIVREVWFYLLRRVNHQDNDKFKRGTNFFNLGNIQEDLHWFVGYRKEKYSKPQLTKAIRRLYERNMIATTRATRGLIITILNYDYYQNPKNYESNNERTTKETRKQRWQQHYKQEEECKNKNNTHTGQKSGSGNPGKKIPQKYYKFSKDFYDYLSRNGGKKKYTEEQIRKGADVIRQLVELDKYDLEDEIRPAMRWAMQDEFWSAQVRSLSQLRVKSQRNGEKKFDNLFNKYTAKKQTPEGEDAVYTLPSEEELERRRKEKNQK